MSYIPNVIEDTGRGERVLDLISRLLQDRIIFLGSEINDQVANNVISQLIFLRANDAKKDVHIYINSPGGHIASGLAIYDTMEFLGCDINTYCIGQAASMGALLLSAGTKGKRHALPNSRIMIHQPVGGIAGTSADIEIQAQEVLHLKETCAKILAHHTENPLETIKNDSERDFYMSAEKAKQYGIIDNVIYTKKNEK